MTTSWDDGSPLDLRVADLLAEYGLTGTFYVPMTAEHGRMTVAQIRELSATYEIGAHTLRHVNLLKVTEQTAKQEIFGSKSWLEDVTGLECLMFCPPMGKFSKCHLEMIREAGYLGFRTVELVSLDFPRPLMDLVLMPTTVQAMSHSYLAFARNFLKRRALGNFWQFVVYGRSTDWPHLARSLLRRAVECGGVFHLWGHSWELEDADQWGRLEEVFRFTSELASLAPSLTNGEVCKHFLASCASINEAA